MYHDPVARAVLAGPDAIIAADRDGVITFWNPGAERIFGLTGEKAIGRSLDIIIPIRLRGLHWDGWRSVTAGGRSRYGDGDVLAVPAVGPDGAALSVEFSRSTRCAARTATWPGSRRRCVT